MQKSREENNSRSDSNEKLKIRSAKRITIGQFISVIVLIIVAVFIARVAFWERDYLDRMEGSDRAYSAQNFIEGGDTSVDDTEPTITDLDNYTVTPDKPRYFSIPSLGIINARIEEVGVLTNGELATPHNIYNVGWWSASGLPGSNQVSVMDAHGGALGNGIFRNLPLIEIGANIEIEMGNGMKYIYTVADTATKSNGSEANIYMSTLETSPEPGKGSLSLITCTGEWSQREQTYSHRFFVRAVLSK